MAQGDGWPAKNTKKCNDRYDIWNQLLRLATRETETFFALNI